MICCIPPSPRTELDDDLKRTDSKFISDTIKNYLVLNIL